MREGWTHTTLGEVAQTQLGKTLPRGEGASENGLPYLRNVNVQWGSVDTSNLNRMVFTSDEADKYRIKTGDILVCEGGEVGRCAVVKTELNGIYFQNAIHRVRVDRTSSGGAYLALWIEQLTRSGVVARFATQQTIAHLSQSKLRALPVALPPLREQKRIVDLMDSVDAAISAAQAEVDAAEELRGDLFDGLLQQFVDELEVRTLGELGEFSRGRRFTKSDYVEDGLGCIHYGQVHTHFGLTANQPVTFVPIEMKGRLRFATTGDVVIAATSEDLDDLGKATVWLGAEDVAVHDDCQIFRHDLDPLFVTHLIASHGFHRQKVQYAAGTKVTRISGPNLAKITVQVPQRSRQEEIGRTMASLNDVAEKAQSALDRLRNLRSSMLSALLSGEHEIPETYDQFLGLPERAQAG